MSGGILARWADIDALLDQVFDQPEEQRRQWVERNCADAELRALVLSLLEADSVRAAEIEARAAAAHDWLSAHAADLPQARRGVLQVLQDPAAGHAVEAAVGEGHPHHVAGDVDRPVVLELLPRPPEHAFGQVEGEQPGVFRDQLPLS